MDKGSKSENKYLSPPLKKREKKGANRTVSLLCPNSLRGTEKYG